MDYLTSGNSYVFRGTVLVASGAILFSGGWFLLSICKRISEWLQNRRWFKTVVRRVIVIAVVVICLLGAGSVMVSMGGTLTTKGWNIISLGEQRNNLIRAVTQEWYLNCGRLGLPPMKGETHYVKEGGEFVWRPFPTLRAIALKSVLSSGLWDYGSPTDRKFFNAVGNYEKKINYVNSKFSSYENLVSMISDPNERIAKTKEHRALIPDKDWFISLDSMQNKLGMLIWSEYRWAITTQLPEASKLLRKRFQEKSTASKSEEGISKKKQ